MVLLLAIAAAAVMVALLILSLRRLAAAERRRRIHRRLGPLSKVVDEIVGKPVFIEGVLLGGDIATSFEGTVRSIEEAHVRAKTLSCPAHPAMRAGDRELSLVGPVQVIFGAREDRRKQGGEVVSVRTVRAGDAIVAEGVLKRVSGNEGGAGYRERTVSYELVPVPDPAWPGRPIAVYSARRQSVVLFGALTVACTILAAALPYSLLMSRHVVAAGAAGAGADSASGSSTRRPACAAEIAARLDRNDVPGARGLLRSCDDPLSRAQVAWMEGEIDEAGAGYAAFRAALPDAPLTLSEVEAVAIADAPAGAALVRRMRVEWYKGPESAAQRHLDCVAERLLGHIADDCLDDRWSRRFHQASFDSVHNLPAYSLHDPFEYVRFLPIVSQRAEQCGSYFDSLEELASRTCAENLGSVRALFAAVVGDRATMERELAESDQLVALLGRLAAAPPSPPAEPARAADFSEELRSRRYDAERALAVAAAAAWFAHDAARFERYVPIIEAHARAVFAEHVDLVRGKEKAPQASHHPSDYSDIDMEMFGLADSATPEAFVGKLRDAGYSSAPRLAALLTARPRHRDAFAAWVRSGFVPVCRTCGIYALIDATFRRREAARVAGEAQLEEAQLLVARRLGEALTHRETWAAVIALESLYAK